MCLMVKFIYSEKATKFCEIFILLLSYVVSVKNKVKISQNFVAFSRYMNFINLSDWTMLPVIVISISCVKLCKCLTGSAITVFCCAIQALSKGKVVGNGKGDKSCFCVFSCCNSCNKRINSIRTEAKPPQPLAPPLQKEKKNGSWHGFHEFLNLRSLLTTPNNVLLLHLSRP